MLYYLKKSTWLTELFVDLKVVGLQRSKGTYNLHKLESSIKSIVTKDIRDNDNERRRKR